MKVCIIGSGYVGLVAGACFADSGNDVICVDIDKEKIAQIGRGEMPIYEPGLREMVLKSVQQNSKVLMLQKNPMTECRFSGRKKSKKSR